MPISDNAAIIGMIQGFRSVIVVSLAALAIYSSFFLSVSTARTSNPGIELFRVLNSVFPSFSEATCISQVDEGIFPVLNGCTRISMFHRELPQDVPVFRMVGSSTT